GSPPRRMKITGTHLKGYKQIARLFWKYGRGDLVQQLGVDETELRSNGEARARGEHPPEELADDLEAMGPTYVKLGQVLAGRPDLLPAGHVKALERLQDKVKPFPFEEVERIVTSELGVRISKAFSSFDPQPIAAASLGQVHAACLRDGRSVVVKVQRPDIRAQVEEDFGVLTEIATFMDAHTEIGRRNRFVKLVDEFHRTIRDELDYEREAKNLATLAKNLEEFPAIEVPQPIEGYCTRCVLTMERVAGHKLTSLSPVALLDFDRANLAETLFRAYLKQVLVDGFFHADPHPGNVFLTDDGRIALLDLGMVGHTTPAMREHLLKMLLAISEGKSEQVSDLLIDMSEKSEQFDGPELRRKVRQALANQQGKTLEQAYIGRTILEVNSQAAQNGLFVPSELALLGKTLLQLEEIGRVLEPTFDTNASIRKNVGELVSRRTLGSATQGGFLTSLMETKAFTMALPNRLNRIMDAVTNAELEVRVKSIDARMVVDGIEKIANRVTTGLILAALIVGAALLMRVETTFRLFGYPGLAMVCFLIAAGGGMWLVVSTVVRDQRGKKARPR
ncbi:MAG TPA: AarF/UbiB family protein, partial [Planctomycetota bacterium]|nr:AarF/UbiB family protein [Planctomycetota bacterium]